MSGHPALYDGLVAAHVASAIIGFGSVAAAGAYGVVARGADRDPAGAAREEVQRFFAGRLSAQWLVLAVPLFGAAALAVRPEGSGFGSLWVVAGWVIWVVVSALLLAVVRPAQSRLRSAPAAPGGPGASARGSPASRLAWAAGACDLLFVVAALLMVTQPG